jgi:hypothetical protein
MLTGKYAFLLQGFDQTSGNGIAAVGSFETDACGLITSGTADYYLGPTSAGYVPSLGGSYTVAADGRGALTLAVGASTMHLAIALGDVRGGVASKGAITEMDPSAGGGPVLSGSMWRQDPTAFALDGIAGPYAFVLNGWNGFGPREAMGGTLTADGAGGLAGGPLDDKLLGNAPPTTTASWAGTYDAPSGSGRSVVAAPALTGASGNAVTYVVGRGRLIALVWDTAAGGRVFSGSMIAQAGPFSLGSLDGNCVAYQTANYASPGYETLNMATLTLFTADGLGGLTITSYDTAAGGNYGTGSGIQYTYAVDAHGQATVYVSPSTPGGKWYLTGPSTGLMLGFDYGVSVGEIVPQSPAPFSAASVDGSYFASQAPGATLRSTASSGVATSTGSGTWATTMDVNSNGVIAFGQAATGTLTVEASGRAIDTNDNVVYLVSPDRFFLMNKATWYPVVLLLER